LLYHQRGGVSLRSFVVASGLLPVCDCKSTTSSAIDQVYMKEKCIFYRFSPFPPAKMGIFLPKHGDFSPKGGDFSGGLPLLPLLLRAAGPKHEAMPCLLACCLVCVSDAPRARPEQ